MEEKGRDWREEGKGKGRSIRVVKDQGNFRDGGRKENSKDMKKLKERRKWNIWRGRMV